MPGAFLVDKKLGKTPAFLLATGFALEKPPGPRGFYTHLTVARGDRAPTSQHIRPAKRNGGNRVRPQQSKQRPGPGRPHHILH